MIQIIGIRAVGEEAWLLDQDGIEEIHRFTEETFTTWFCRKMENRLQISHILHTPWLTKFLNVFSCRGCSNENKKCPIPPADLGLLHNHVMHALVNPAAAKGSPHFFWESCAAPLKTNYLAFWIACDNRMKTTCTAHQRGNSNNDHSSRPRIAMERRKKQNNC